jgi:molybdate transport system substrate-binding protein
MLMRALKFVAVAALWLAVAACERAQPAGATASSRVMVFAAASTAAVIEEAGRRFEAQTGSDVVTSFDASSTLAKQIIAGAPADVFLSANLEWMDAVEQANAIRAASRQDLLGNELALIAPRGAKEVHRKVAEGAKRADVFEMGQEARSCVCGRSIDMIAKSPSPSPSLCALCASAVNLLQNAKRVVIADPSHVPAGRYAKQALEALACWDTLKAKVMPALDVRAALRLVEAGEADAAIVYATDAKRSDKVDIVAAIPPTLHEPINYPVALCTESAAAAAFVEFLRSDEMRIVFEDAGFVLRPTDEGER